MEQTASSPSETSHNNIEACRGTTPHESWCELVTSARRIDITCIHDDTYAHVMILYDIRRLIR